MIRHLAPAALFPLGLVCFTSPATAQVCPGDDVYEPNQSCATAVMLTAGLTPALAILGTDHDMWGFTVPPGEDLTIDVFFLHANGNIDVKLVTSDCNNLYDRGDSTDDDEHVTATNTGATPVVMVLHVYGVGSNFVCNDYSLGAIIGQSNMSAYCFGDLGSGTPCPCGNDNDGSVPESGCANGVFASGAHLTGSGVASLSADTLVLATTGLEPSNSGLYFQANNDLSPGNIWGDGLQCAGGQLKRLGVRFSDATGYSDTSGYPQPISVKAGNVMAGDTKYYQCWYRNPMNSPCGWDFNSSNGYAVTWLP
jgi:hypothetical protein